METVGRIERAGPTHARNLQQLTGLDLTVRQGEPFHALRIDLELSCGTANFGSGANLSLSLRSCHVTLQRANCTVIPHTRYEHALKDGAFTQSGTASTSSSQAREVGLNLEGDAGTTMAVPAVKARLGGLFRWNKGHETKTSESEQREEKIDLVVTAGQDRWRVGDPMRGDARRKDGCLIGSYFGERRNEEGDPLPLCTVARDDASGDIELTVTVTASFAQLEIRSATGGIRPQDDGLHGQLKKASSHAEKAHTQQIEELRRRVAGLVVGKALGNAQRSAGHVIPAGELALSKLSLCLLAKRATAGPSDE